MTSSAPDPTNGVITVNATLSENACDFTVGDVTPVNATVLNFSGSGSNYSFDLFPLSAGTVSAIVSAGTFHDAANNPNTASNTLSRTYVFTGPIIALSSIAPDPTNTSPIPVTVTISSATTDLSAGDISVSNATVSNFVGTGSSYSFDLVPSGQGLVTARVAAGAFHDAATNRTRRRTS